MPVEWWEQPRGVVLFARPFGELVEMATDVLAERARQCGRLVSLIAHSFGAHIALRVAARAPQHIHSLTLLAPVFNVIDGLVRVARSVVERLPHAASLAHALDLLAAQPHNRDCFWLLVDELMATPDFLRVYFSDRADALYTGFSSLMAREPLFDPSAFRTILQDSWETTAPDSPKRLECPVDIVFGSQDVLTDPASEGPVWTGYFPHARICCVDAGHFVHLELQPDEWLPKPSRAPA
ncbi:alpha/beta fold hydrolase [Trinickia symbiotica]|uniref:alpha/beta fold hydrolase n=1 Tax=Trinickia symbiotica TaxID=863227 RepID=UPI0015E7DB0F|nr:alpha/beta hydrolase [Trinickia symbiotica]